MDNVVLERIFSNEHSLSNLPTYYGEMTEESKNQLESIFRHMGRINEMEADMLELHLVKGVPQSTIGKIFGYTQPNIHYRIMRALDRLRVILKIQIFSEEELEEKLRGFFTNEKDILVMKLVYLYSSQSLVAREIGESQGKVRYRFLRCLKAMENCEELADLYNALNVINNNITLLRRGKNEETRRVVL
jgi:DNA-directed RNA polymerase specialized sigma24 family protein